MASFNLKKGASFELKKSITNVKLEAGWDPATKPGVNFDLDLWCIGLTQTQAGSKIFDNDHIVGYFNVDLKNKATGGFDSPDKMICHSGDDRNGNRAGVDERITVNLQGLPDTLNEIGVFISIYEADARKQTFGQVNSAFIQVVNAENDDNLCKYDLGKEFSNDSIVQVGSLIKDNGIWSFKAVGAGSGVPADINTVLGNF